MSGQQFQIVGRYLLGAPIASGGMATVYLGRPLSLPRVVAVKRLSPDLARDEAFVRMFLDEVQLLCRVRHRNVVAPIEHFQDEGEFFIVMEYVEGLSLAQLSAAGEGPLDVHIASKIMDGVLTGLHAAHDAVDSSGQPLKMVHRDVSPHNILVGTDGESRIADFGIAKAAWRAHVTQHGERKGKPGYMAPEQWSFGEVDRRTDVFAAGVVLWELLTGTRLFPVQPMRNGAAAFDAKLAPPSAQIGRSCALDEVTMRALAIDPDDRYRDATEMANALRAAAPPAHDSDLGTWVLGRGKSEIARRAELITELESVRPSEMTPVNRGYAVPEVAARPHALPAHPTQESAPPSAGRPRVRAPGGLRQAAMMALTIAGALVGASYVSQSRNPPTAHQQGHDGAGPVPAVNAARGQERAGALGEIGPTRSAARDGRAEEIVSTDRSSDSPAIEGAAASASAAAEVAKVRAVGTPRSPVAASPSRQSPLPLRSEAAVTSATPAYDPLRDARRH